MINRALYPHFKEDAGIRANSHRIKLRNMFVNQYIIKVFKLLLY